MSRGQLRASFAVGLWEGAGAVPSRRRSDRECAGLRLRLLAGAEETGGGGDRMRFDLRAQLVLATLIAAGGAAAPVNDKVSAYRPEDDPSLQSRNLADRADAAGPYRMASRSSVAWARSRTMPRPGKGT